MKPQTSVTSTTVTAHQCKEFDELKVLEEEQVLKLEKLRASVVDQVRVIAELEDVFRDYQKQAECLCDSKC